MYIPLCLSILSLSLPLSLAQTTTNYPSALVPKKLLYQFNPITWVENLAIRPNGLIIPTSTTSPLLNQLDPKTGTLTLVHDFSAHGNAIQGITAVRPDVFVVDVLTCDIPGTLACTPGSVTTWVVDFCDYGGRGRHIGKGAKADVHVNEVAAFPKAGFLNGMAALSDDVVLIADSYLGGIWSLNLTSGAKDLLFTDLSMNGTAAIATGINGVRVPGDGWMYYTNSAKGTLNRIPIDSQTGAKTGEAEVLADGFTGPDDLEINLEPLEAYLCNGALNELLRVPLNGKGEIEVVAELPGPTSVRWGGYPGGGKVLYASTIGGLLQYVQHNVTVGGAIYRVDV